MTQYQTWQNIYHPGLRRLFNVITGIFLCCAGNSFIYIVQTLQLLQAENVNSGYSSWVIFTVILLLWFCFWSYIVLLVYLRWPNSGCWHLAIYVGNGLHDNYSPYVGGCIKRLYDIFKAYHLIYQYSRSLYENRVYNTHNLAYLKPSKSVRTASSQSVGKYAEEYARR